MLRADEMQMSLSLVHPFSATYARARARCTVGHMSSCKPVAYTPGPGAIVRDDCRSIGLVFYFFWGGGGRNTHDVSFPALVATVDEQFAELFGDIRGLPMQRHAGAIPSRAAFTDNRVASAPGKWLRSDLCTAHWGQPEHFKGTTYDIIEMVCD